MVASRRFQVALGCAGAALALASTSCEAYNPRHIVLGKNGKLLLDVDPNLYFHDRTKKRSSALRALASQPTALPHAEHEGDKIKSQPSHNNALSSRVSKSSTSEMSDAEVRKLASEETLNDVVLGQVDIVVVVSAVRDAREQDMQATDKSLEDFEHQAQRELEPNEHYYHQVQENDYDEFSSALSSPLMPEEENLETAVRVPEVSMMVDHNDIFDSALPIVPGSILFAEMVNYLFQHTTKSCLFVGFIGYLVHSIPLWSRFSRGQRWCLVAAFTTALLYQLAAISWYFDLVSSEVMIGLSSLITRMISLGMVPITTTSFVGRAREACSEQQQTSQQVATNSSSSHGRGSRHHPRARAS